MRGSSGNNLLKLRATGLGMDLFRRHQQSTTVGGSLALLLIACGLPLLATTIPVLRSIAGEAVADSAGLGPLSWPSLWLLLGRTLAIATTVTLASLGVGVPLGLLLGRFDIIGRRWAIWLHALPLFLPPFILGLGWHAFWGTEGLWGNAWTSSLLFSAFGLSATLTLALAPLISLLTIWGLRGIAPRLEEAARVAQPPQRVLTAIVLPLVRPAIFLGALCVLGLCLSETGLSVFLRVGTYVQVISGKLGAVRYAPGDAMLMVVPLLGLAFLLTLADRHNADTATSPSQGAATLPPPSLPPYRLGRYRLATSLGVWSVIAVSLLPLVGMASQTHLHSLMSSLRGTGHALATSLISGALACGAIVMAGGVLGHAGTRGTRGGKRAYRIADGLALFAFFTPGSVLAIGLITIWNRPSLAWLYDSIGILAVGLFARYAVLGVRISRAIMQHHTPDEEQAAACAGATYFARLGRITLPAQARQWLGASLLILLFCLRDVDTCIGFYPPGLQPFTVRLFSLEANGGAPLVNALALLQVIATGLLLLASAHLLVPRQHS